MRENEGVALRAICWSEIFPWLGIGKCFRLALSLRLLVFGAAALLLTLLGWWTIATLFSHDGAISRSWSDTFGKETVWRVIDQSVPQRPFSAGAFGNDSGLNNPDRSGPVFAAWATFSRPVLRLFSHEPMSVGDFVALLLSCFWSLAVWAYFGAAICRVAAVELATGERVGWGAAFRWARGKWLAYFSAPVVPMAGIAVAVVPVFVLGLLMKINLFAAVGGLIWPLVLIAAFVMAMLLAGVMLGWPLMWATISVEGTDSFDALSRTYAYVFQKPFRYLIYAMIAAIVGWLGWIVVENFAAAVIWLATWAASWGTGPVQMRELLTGSGNTSFAQAGTALIAFWSGCVKLLALGYLFSYFGVASTAVYYQMRRAVDARETDEVFLDADESEKGFGLPTLQKDAAGAAEVAASPTPSAAAEGQADADAVE